MRASGAIGDLEPAPVLTLTVSRMRSDRRPSGTRQDGPTTMAEPQPSEDPPAGTSARGPAHPSGPEEVRRAVLDAAAALFVERGVDRVSLRDIAAAANVHPALIGRYIGHRDDLVLAVFDDLSTQLAAAVLENPLSGQGFGPDTVMGKWSTRRRGPGDRWAPRLPAATGSTRSWRWPRRCRRGTGSTPRRLGCGPHRSSPPRWGGGSSRTTSIEAGELDAVPLDVLRDELARSARRLGATPWPSPPDPSPQPR